MRKSKRKSHILIFVIIFAVIAVSVSIAMVYLSSKPGTPDPLNDGKLRVSAGKTTSYEVTLAGLEPGDNITKALTMRKETNSPSVFVRAKLYFSTESTNSEVRALVDELNTYTMEIGSSSLYTWEAKGNNYYYVINSMATKNCFEFANTDDVELTKGFKLPSGVAGLSNIQRMSEIKFHIDLQALESARVDANLYNVDGYFLDRFGGTMFPANMGKYTTSTDSIATRYTSNSALVGKYYIEMGSYPQTLYEGSDTVMIPVTGEDYTLKGANGAVAKCPVYTDGADKYVRLETAGNNACYYKVEPVRWVVVGQADGTALPSDFDLLKTSLDGVLVVSEKILTQSQFDACTVNHKATNSFNDFANSTLGEFMNGAFIDELFTDVEREDILDTSLVTLCANGSKPQYLYSTAKMFTLSVRQSTTLSQEDTFLVDCMTADEATYGSAYNQLSAKVTDLARAMGVSTVTDTGVGAWWLRGGLGTVVSKATRVSSANAIGEAGIKATDVGVRGAFVWKLRDAQKAPEQAIKSGKYTSKNTTDWGYTDNENLMGRYFVEFGSYPQTKYTGAESALALINGETFTLNNSNIVKVYTDGVSKYVKHTSNATTAYYKVEPVRWVVIGLADGSPLPVNFDISTTNISKLLVISEKILTMHMFADREALHPTTNAYNDWTNSQLNAFMNGDFLDDLFTDTQKLRIQNVDLVTTYSAKDGTMGYTTDNAKMFPLSMSAQRIGAFPDNYLADIMCGEVINCGTNFYPLGAQITDLSKTLTSSEAIESDVFGYYWLRAGAELNYNNGVMAGASWGDVLDGATVDMEIVGVRGSMVLDISGHVYDSEAFATGEYTTTSDTRDWGYTSNANLIGKYFVQMGEYPQSEFEPVNYYDPDFSLTGETIAVTYNTESGVAETSLPVYYDGVDRFVQYTVGTDTKYYKIEPVRWVVAGTATGRALASDFDINTTTLEQLLLVSEKVLSLQAFESSLEGGSMYNRFDTSTLSDYMNNQLFGALFSPAQKSTIVESSYKTTYCTSSVTQVTAKSRVFGVTVTNQGMNFCGDTFQASSMTGTLMVSTGTTYNGLLASATDFASATGVEVGEGNDYASWWMRTGSTTDAQRACIVDTTGKATTRIVTDATTGVRPAIVINMANVDRGFVSGKYNSDATAGDYERTANDNLHGMQFIELGEYPQTRVNCDPEDLTLVEGEYFTLEDYNGVERQCPVYADDAHRYVLCANATGESGYYRIEPVRWVVVGRADGSALPAGFDVNNTTLDKVLVVSEKILTKKVFDDMDTLHDGTSAYNDWMNSSLHDFMNGTFINELFSEQERARIQDTTLSTTFVDQRGVVKERTSTAKMFTLSLSRQWSPDTHDDTYLADALNGSAVIGSANCAKLTAQATPLATALGVHVNASGYGGWWLRCGVDSSYTNACVVNESGYVIATTAVDNLQIGVRGAFVLTL